MNLNIYNAERTQITRFNSQEMAAVSFMLAETKRVWKPFVERKALKQEWKVYKSRISTFLKSKYFTLLLCAFIADIKLIVPQMSLFKESAILFHLFC